MEISKEVDKELEMASELIGIEKKELVNQALKLYLDNLRKMLELRKEMKAWEELGYQSLITSENKLWKKEKSG